MRKIAPLAGLGVGRYANGRIGADRQRAIANVRRLHGCRRHPAAGRGPAYSCRKVMRLSFVLSLRRRIRRPSQLNIASR
jgi:hypothetical protein